MGTGYNTKFDLDLKYGQELESLIQRMFDGDITVEVKRDDKEPLKSGNIFVEVEYLGEPSGIMTTKADYWAHAWRPGCFFMMPTADLRKLVDRALRTSKRVSGGDGFKSQGALVPLDWLIWEPFYE